MNLPHFGWSAYLICISFTRLFSYNYRWVCLPACCLSVCLSLYFLAQFSLHSSHAKLALALCMSAWGACLWIRVCECACANCVFVLPGTVHAIPKDPCVCVSVRVCLHHSSCLLTSIRSLMTELHSESLRAATFTAPPRQTHISNNASWDWSQVMQRKKKWNLHISVCRATILFETEQHWIDSLFWDEAGATPLM